MEQHLLHIFELVVFPKVFLQTGHFPYPIRFFLQDTQALAQVFPVLAGPPQTAHFEVHSGQQEREEIDDITKGKMK